MVKNIIHNPVFRIFTPMFYGGTMYILILLIFDSIEKLSENFFSFEIFLCLIITYLIFESLRLYAILIERKCPGGCSISRRIVIQGGGSILIALLITYSIVTFYFVKLVGFSSFGSWLKVFNTIFILTSVLYNMIYFSFFYLNKTNVSQLDEESILSSNIKIELDTYKNKINPEFLYDSLETLISLTRRSADEADKFILKLSDVYRNILSTKNTEFVSIKEELGVSEKLIEIFNYKLNDRLIIKIDGSIKKSNLQLISGTLVVIIEDIVNRSLITDFLALRINCKLDNDFLEISHIIQSKLRQVFSKQTEIQNLEKAYKYFGKRSMSMQENNGIRTYRIPVFEIENL